MKKRLFLASLLTLGISATSYGHVTEPITQLSASEFKPIVVLPAVKEPIAQIYDFSGNYPKIDFRPEIKVKNEPKSVILEPNYVIPGKNKAVKGKATWFCRAGVSSCHYKYPDNSKQNFYAAAGSEIRKGNWRGRNVKVCDSNNCITVKLVDWCGCPGNRIIDLYADAFDALGSLGQGVMRVTVSWK